MIRVVRLISVRHNSVISISLDVKIRDYSYNSCSKIRLLVCSYSPSATRHPITGVSPDTIQSAYSVQLVTAILIPYRKISAQSALPYLRNPQLYVGEASMIKLHTYTGCSVLFSTFYSVIPENLRNFARDIRAFPPSDIAFICKVVAGIAERTPATIHTHYHINTFFR